MYINICYLKIINKARKSTIVPTAALVNAINLHKNHPNLDALFEIYGMPFFLNLTINEINQKYASNRVLQFLPILSTFRYNSTEYITQLQRDFVSYIRLIFHNII